MNAPYENQFSFFFSLFSLFLRPRCPRSLVPPRPTFKLPLISPADLGHELSRYPFLEA